MIYLLFFVDGFWARLNWEGAGPTAVLMTLGNIPYKIRTKKKMIKIVSLIHPRADLNSVMEEILSSVPSSILYNGTIYGVSIGGIIGDLPGSNSLCGFTTSFSLTKLFCRYCFAKQNWMEIDLQQGRLRNINETRMTANCIKDLRIAGKKSDADRMASARGIFNECAPCIQHLDVHQYSVLGILHLILISKGLCKRYFTDILFPYLLKQGEKTVDIFQSRLQQFRFEIVNHRGTQYIRVCTLQEKAKLTGSEIRYLVKVAMVAARGLVDDKTMGHMRLISELMMLVLKSHSESDIPFVSEKVEQIVQQIFELVSSDDGMACLRTPNLHYLSHLKDAKAV